MLDEDSSLNFGESNSLSIWLPEPAQVDSSYAHRREHTLDWLAKSSTPRARECRRFLNENLSRFPKETQEYFRHCLRIRWYETLFELIVARLLQEMGAEISFESRNQQRKCPDFMARFPDVSIVVEAVSPAFNREVEDESTSRIPLLDFIESKVPEGWRTAVWELPDIGPSDSKTGFKKEIERMLDIPSPTDSSTDLEWADELSTGVIRLHLFPSNSARDKILVEPALTAWGDSEKRIKYAIHRKRKQVRSSESPVLLAVQNTSISGSFEDYDIASFGRTFDRYDQLMRLVEVGFQPTGILNEKRDEAPTYAGVLAFVQTGFLGGRAPVLYQHPRFSGILPRAALELEVRTYDHQAACIRVKESENVDLMRGMRFVRV